MQTVFRRKEIKYIINKEQYKNFCDAIVQYTVPDKYFETKISNIYFDTDDFLLIRRSVEKPIYKEKLRLRCYGEVTDDSESFVEIKKKYKRVVYKRRTVMKYSEAVDFLCNKKTFEHSTQIMKEIGYMLSFYGELKPKLVLIYNRRSYKAREEEGLRITADKDICFSDCQFDLRENIIGKPVIKDKILLEIKSTDAFPLWLTKILCDNKIYPTSFSKYGYIYTNYLLKETN